MRRVVFLCIGNACRSQMAEGFARAYGRDVMVAASAGLAPAAAVPADTIRVMREKNIDISLAVPKGLDEVASLKPDLIVNMSGSRLSNLPEVEIVEWKVDDPYMGSLERYRASRDLVESLVMQLVMHLRAARAAGGPPADPPVRQSPGAPADQKQAGGEPGPGPGKRGWRKGL